MDRNKSPRVSVEKGRRLLGLPPEKLGSASSEVISDDEHVEKVEKFALVKVTEVSNPNSRRVHS